MGRINYEIPDDLHRQLKVRAAEEGVTLLALIKVKQIPEPLLIAMAGIVGLIFFPGIR